MVGRIPILEVAPVVQHGRRPAKAVPSEPFEVSATIFREGHDLFGAEVVLTSPHGIAGAPVRMHQVPHAVDRWAATVAADAPGDWTFTIQAWSDPVATWQRDTLIKVPANVDVELMFAEGAALLRVVAELDGVTTADRAVLQDALRALVDDDRPVEARLAAVEDPRLSAVLRRHPLRELLTWEGPYPLQVDRARALVGSWYEFFPRSEGAQVQPDGTISSGTFATAAERLPAVAAMGFDVVYLPPIHPIGRTNRKGRNNTLTPGPDDVGSPWAIGAAEGGHDAVHPDLGTLADFAAFVKKAADLGLEIALDLALQAAPDHPWVAAHPEWFTERIDGSIAYAENPPKKYQDIYPINFDRDPEGIYQEVKRVVRHWMGFGVRIFRVDNPHTKPVAFWERLLGEIRSSDPDVLFLAEAFTKPPMMRTLAEIGFHQSYTYFTWRNRRDEIADYLRELSTETAHVLRPNFFANTPDILHEYLQHGGPAAFRVRATLAATASPTWGVYAGFELAERIAVRPGSEEYLDSEKYQLRPRDWAAAEAAGVSLAPYLATLNAFRRAHPALAYLRNIVVHPTDNEQILVFSKHAAGQPDGSDQVIIALNLDPHHPQETMVHLDLAAFGFPADARFDVHDALTDQVWSWGAEAYIRLDPTDQVAHLLTVRGPR